MKLKNPFKKRSVENIQEKIDAAPKYTVNFKQGLNEEQVKARVEAGLDNKIKDVVSKSYLEIIVKNVLTVLNVLLISIAIVMAVFRLTQRMFFIIILALNIGISLFQDIKAKHLVSKLSLISNPRAQVIRDGVTKDILFDEIVLSDIIVLKAGKTIPCDAKIVYGSVRVNESFLSGETDAVLKKEKDIAYAQSYVTSGTAYAQVVKIGNANYANILQEKARSFERPRSEILKSLQTIIRVISIGTIVIGVAEIITAAVTGKFGIDFKTTQAAIDAITSSLVAMIPSGMYLMTSITLTVGVIVLARHRMLVRELYSIEMLARVNIVCVDKTGTLTTGNMAVENLIPVGGVLRQTIETIIGQILYVTKDENLTARALRDRYATKKIEEDCASIPFDSEKKYSAASFNNHTYVMGAFGFIKITNRDAIKSTVEKYEKEGKRVLIIAEGKGNIDDNKLPSKLTCIAIIIMSETIKKDARANIEWFKNNDVDLRVISGDSANSLRAIAIEVGLDAKQVISLDGLSDIEVRMAAQKYQIFARVTPEQKKLIIAELRKQGNTVAMIGDGVNDLLALKQADCSIAMANGADAAKSVAHLVSLDSNFSALPKVVEEGRRVINNLQRVCSVFLVKTIFAFFMSFTFVAISWFYPSAKYPFSTNNLFAWEVLTIGLAPFFIALEPNKDRITSGFIGNIVKEAIPAAITQICVSLPLVLAATFAPSYFPLQGAVAMSVISLSIMSLVIMLHVCMPLNKYRSVVLGGTFIAMMGVFALDSVMRYEGITIPLIKKILDIEYTSINNACLLLGLLSFIIMVPLYFLLAKYLRIFINKHKKVKDEEGTGN